MACVRLMSAAQHGAMNALFTIDDVVLGFIQSTKHFLEMTASLSDILICRAIFRGARGYFGPLFERFQLPAK